MCCGATGPSDWENNVYFNCSSEIYIHGVCYYPVETCGVPSSCCIMEPDIEFDTQCGYGIRQPNIEVCVCSKRYFLTLF